MVGEYKNLYVILSNNNQQIIVETLDEVYNIIINPDLKSTRVYEIKSTLVIKEKEENDKIH